MTTIQLKNDFHKLIDTIDDRSILITFYDILSKAKRSKEGKLWNKLSLSEQKELLEIEKESFTAKNLVSQAKMKEKYAKWL